MKQFGIFLVSLAVTLVMLHSIAPHTHDTVQATSNQVQIGVKKENQTGFLSLLKDLFNQDLGQEHLEHFQNQDCDVQIIAPFITQAAIKLPPIITTEVIEHHEIYLEVIRDAHYRSKSPLRGPPSIG